MSSYSNTLFSSQLQGTEQFPPTSLSALGFVNNSNSIFNTVVPSFKTKDGDKASADNCGTSEQGLVKNNDLSNVNPNSNDTGDFESGFSSMLMAYSLMTAEQKAERVRKLIRSLPMKELGFIEELFDVFSTAGSLKVSNVPSFTSLYGGHSCDCSEGGCPHKLELERIDEFYNEVFF